MAMPRFSPSLAQSNTCGPHAVLCSPAWRVLVCMLISEREREKERKREREKERERERGKERERERERESMVYLGTAALVPSA